MKSIGIPKRGDIMVVDVGRIRLALGYGYEFGGSCKTVMTYHVNNSETRIGSLYRYSSQFIIG